MDALHDLSAEDLTQLRDCVRGLGSLIGLPHQWTGGEPAEVMSTVLDALLRILSLGFVSARLHAPEGGDPIDMIRVADSLQSSAGAGEIAQTVDAMLADGPISWPSRAQISLRDVDVFVAAAPLGTSSEVGIVTAGSTRRDFPSETERLVLDVAANQVTIGLLQAQLVSQQRRGAVELDAHVARQLAGEKRLLEMVASGCSLTDVLNAVCSFVEDTATHCYCGVYVIDWSGPTFHNAAAPTLPASFNDPIDGLPVRCEIGPCARAACLKTQVIAADIESDALWQTSSFRALALTNGLRSCWSTPIYSLAGHVLGTFAIYQRIPGSPTPLQQDLIAQVTHIASIAIERAQSEAALRRSEAFLNEGQRLSLTGSFSWRVATDDIAWSEQLYRIYDIEVGTPVTLELIRTRVHPEDISLLEKMVDQARVGGRDFEWQYRLLMPDQSIKYMHAVAHAMRDRDGQLEYIAVAQDVTARRMSEDALAKARSELAKVARITSLGVLTASIAHEVNQPLSGIITNAATCLRMLDADPPNLEGARETARRTIRDGNRASDVITRLRALFRKEEFTPEWLDLNEVTREVIALSLSDLQRNRVVLRSQLAEDLPAVTGDRVQLQQVILNLIRNGSDALAGIDDRPRRLLIRTERDGSERVRVSVRDAGVGVDAQSMNKLFDAFYTTKSDGMGIGLSVSRSIIERHRGRLWAESNDGPGATFSFSIPALQTGAAAAQPR